MKIRIGDWVRLKEGCLSYSKIENKVGLVQKINPGLGDSYMDVDFGEIVIKNIPCRHLKVVKYPPGFSEAKERITTTLPQMLEGIDLRSVEELYKQAVKSKGGSK